MLRWAVPMAWVVILVTTAVVLAQRVTRYHRAEAQFRRAQDQQDHVRRLQKQVDDLRASVGPVLAGLGPDPSLTLAEGMPQAVAAAGLEPDVLASVAPAGQARVGDPAHPVVHQRGTVTLVNIGLGKLGAILAALDHSQPGWWVRSIDLSAMTTRPSAGAASGGDVPLRIVIALERLTPEPPAAREREHPGRIGGAR